MQQNNAALTMKYSALECNVATRFQAAQRTVHVQSTTSNFNDDERGRMQERIWTHTGRRSGRKMQKMQNSTQMSGVYANPIESPAVSQQIQSDGNSLLRKLASGGDLFAKLLNRALLFRQ